MNKPAELPIHKHLAFTAGKLIVKGRKKELSVGFPFYHLRYTQTALFKHSIPHSTPPHHHTNKEKLHPRKMKLGITMLNGDIFENTSKLEKLTGFEK